MYTIGKEEMYNDWLEPISFQLGHHALYRLKPSFRWSKQLIS